MAKKDSDSLKRRLRNYFATGLLVLVPVVVTIYILVRLFVFLDGLLGNLIGGFLGSLFGTGGELRVPGLGLVALVLLILLTGMVARNYVGRKVIELGDQIITRVPLVNRIYSTVQQISRAFFAEKREFFKRAVLIEYPRKGVYCIAFFTQDTRGEIQEHVEEDLVGVFVPTTPNPTSGFFLFVPRADVIELEMPIEEALTLVVSGGAVLPDEPKREEPLILRPDFLAFPEPPLTFVEKLLKKLRLKTPRPPLPKS